jgi:hypothetical protein
MGIIWKPLFLALMVTSNVCKGWGGKAFPVSLYKIAEPSGIGKKRVPSWDYSLISGWSGLVVIVSGVYITS